MRRVAPVLYARKSRMYNTSAQKAQVKMTMMAVPRAIVFCAETEMPGHGKDPCIVPVKSVCRSAICKCTARASMGSCEGRCISKSPGPESSKAFVDDQSMHKVWKLWWNAGSHREHTHRQRALDQHQWQGSSCQDMQHMLLLVLSADRMRWTYYI